MVLDNDDDAFANYAVSFENDEDDDNEDSSKIMNLIDHWSTKRVLAKGADECPTQTANNENYDKENSFCEESETNNFLSTLVNKLIDICTIQLIMFPIK